MNSAREHSSYDVVGSVVLYNNPTEMIERVAKCFLNTDLKVKLVLVDNGERKFHSEILSDPRIDYIPTSKNHGFGKAHNIAIKKYIESSRYHVVINPDIYFHNKVIDTLFHHLNNDPSIGIAIPQVLNNDGSIQYVNKRIPRPFDLVFRRLFYDKPVTKTLLRPIFDSYEIKDFDLNQRIECPYISGCFMFIRTQAFKDVGLFDHRYFMYLEDTDLSRRITAKYKGVVFSDCQIFHDWTRGSYHDYKMLYYNAKSAIQYFNKWGWVFDKARKEQNKKVKYY